MTYNSLEAVGKAFYEATQDETDGLFKQGEVIYNAVQQGFNVDEVCEHCTSIVKRTKRTIYKRYSVRRTFPKPFPLPFEYHALAADVVDYRIKDEQAIAAQQAQAHAWLQKAIAEEWGTVELKTAIQKTRGDATTYTRTVLVNNAEATLDEFGEYTATLFFNEGVPAELTQKRDWKVLVTIVLKETAQEAEAQS